MRRQVVEIECSRCKRVERQTIVKGADLPGVDWASGPDTTVLSVMLMNNGKPVLQFTFSELCAPCFKTVLNHLEAIRKHIKGASPDRAPTKPSPSPVLQPGPRALDPGIAILADDKVVELGAKKKVQG